MAAAARVRLPGGLAESLDRNIASTTGTRPRRHTICDAPPLDARPGAALITAAVRILDGSDLRVLGELLAPARDGASRKAREAGGSAATSAPGTTALTDSETRSSPW